MLAGAPYWQHRDFILKILTRKIRIIPSVLTKGFLLLGSYMLPFLPTPVFPSWNLKRWSRGLCRLPCMLLLCVCWWKWCDVDPRMLLLLLELVELLSGLGVAIVVLDSGSSAQAAMQRVKLRPLCLQTGHCATWTQQLHQSHVCGAAAFRFSLKCSKARLQSVMFDIASSLMQSSAL